MVVGDSENLPRESSQEDGSAQLKAASPENKLITWLKGLLTFFILLAVVVSSFWISFQLGKRIIMPVKKSPENRLNVAMPEPPPSNKALLELEMALSAEAKKVSQKIPDVPKVLAVKTQVAKAVTTTLIEPSISEHLVAKAAPVRRSVPKVISQPKRVNQYYKVQAGYYAERDSAQELIDKLQSNGYATYLKKVGSGWRVQVGAFKTQKEAAGLRGALLSNGFSSEIVYE